MSGENAKARRNVAPGVECLAIAGFSDLGLSSSLVRPGQHYERSHVIAGVLPQVFPDQFRRFLQNRLGCFRFAFRDQVHSERVE